MVARDEVVGGRHILERNVGVEEIEGDFVEPPQIGADTEVLAAEIAGGSVVLPTRIPFYASAAGHEDPPEDMFARTIASGIVGVGPQAVFPTERLGHTDQPTFAGGNGHFEVFDDALVVVVVALEGGTFDGFEACDLRVNLHHFDFVDRDGMVVRIQVADELSEGLLLSGGDSDADFAALFVGPTGFLAEVPGEGEVVAEAGDEFAVVKLAGVGEWRATVLDFKETFVFGFGDEEVNVHALDLEVGEDALPLGEFADVE